jgi:hypothetical protein
VRVWLPIHLVGNDTLCTVSLHSLTTHSKVDFRVHACRAVCNEDLTVADPCLQRVASLQQQVTDLEQEQVRLRGKVKVGLCMLSEHGCNLYHHLSTFISGRTPLSTAMFSPLSLLIFWFGSTFVECANCKHATPTLELSSRRSSWNEVQSLGVCARRIPNSRTDCTGHRVHQQGGRGLKLAKLGHAKGESMSLGWLIYDGNRGACG